MAKLEGRSEAELIRAAIDEFTAARARPIPKLPLFDSSDPTWASRDEELLRGFGEE